MVEFKHYNSDFLQKHVDLIWEVTDQWKYGYQTSLESIEKKYTQDGFGPNSRIYAFDGDRMVGFAGADIGKDQEGQAFARMRLPLVLPEYDEGFVLSQQLMDKIEIYLAEHEVGHINSPAGVGLGPTMEQAEALGYNQKNELYIRTYGKVNELELSGDTSKISSFTDEDEDEVKEIFKTKIGMSEQQGEGFFNWALTNSRRKWDRDPSAASWQIYHQDGDIAGFSYLMQSDHLPHIGNSMPIYFSAEVDGREVIDQLLSAHLEKMPQIKLVGNYLMPNLYHLRDLYESFGFSFDPAYMYEKQL